MTSTCTKCKKEYDESSIPSLEWGQQLASKKKKLCAECLGIPQHINTTEGCGACAAEKKYGGVSALHTCHKALQSIQHMDSGNRNEQLLRNFVIHCNENPVMEFYEALIDWSKYHFIYGSMREINLKDKDWLEDLHYISKPKKVKKL